MKRKLLALFDRNADFILICSLPVGAFLGYLVS